MSSSLRPLRCNGGEAERGNEDSPQGPVANAQLVATLGADRGAALISIACLAERERSRHREATDHTACSAHG